MRISVIIALRVVIAVALVGSVIVQTVMVPLLWADLDGAEVWARTTFAIIVVLGVLTMQVSAICIWQLLSLVRKGAVFSRAAFKYVNVVIGAIATASILTFALAVLLAPGGIAPGIVGLVCGFALVIAGVALIVVVMRALLDQAVSREAEAQLLRSELDEVI
ncbi:DUF2975 domain-containing protein [Cryobacterium sp. W22_MBD10_FK3]|uniref:DUF2975 domain-containing protein n=1 Tax=Cryobacterium sp. W22_MBD10_FK3 TaxID=3240273 RepID=UPI003F936F54